MDSPRTPKQDPTLGEPDTSERSHYFEALNGGVAYLISSVVNESLHQLVGG